MRVLAKSAAAVDKVTALDIEIVPPTVVSGGIHWKIHGDDNRNASVKVEYRRLGSSEWKDGLDLFRLQNEDMNAFPGGKSGDTILVHAGVYRDHREHYNDGVEGQTEPRLATPFDGTYYLTADGTPDHPITIKAAGGGEAIFDGTGNAVLFNMMGGDYHHFEGITVRNTEVAFLTGIKGIAGSDGFALTDSRIEDVGRGFRGDSAGSDDFYIADNVFVGRHSKTKLLGWTDAWKDFPGFPEEISGPGGSEYAVKVYGRGHVVYRRLRARAGPAALRPEESNGVTRVHRPGCPFRLNERFERRALGASHTCKRESGCRTPTPHPA